MTYKDKDKQREANRQAQARFKAKGITKGTAIGITTEGITYENGGITVPDKLGPVIPKRGKDIKCFEDLSPSIQRVIDMMSDDKTEHKRRTAITINYQHQFPDRYHSQDAVISGPAVTGKPGDADYNGVCTEAWRVERGR